jgi:hypothetical protein
MDDLHTTCLNILDEISDELRKRSSAHMDDVLQPLPPFVERDGKWEMEGSIEDGKIYQIPFDGTDAHAEAIERSTGLTFLGDSTESYSEEIPCHMSGKMTQRRVLLAKTY